MDNIPQQEAQDLADSLPITESQSWGGAVFMVIAIIFGFGSKIHESLPPPKFAGFS